MMHVHRQVREVAKAICGELYEVYMGDNEFYETWKKQNPGVSSKELERRFIERNWGKCIGKAREALTMMLTDASISEEMKEDVMDVLVKDRSLVRGRV